MRIVAVRWRRGGPGFKWAIELGLWLGFWLVLASVAQADAPYISPRPLPRLSVLPRVSPNAAPAAASAPAPTVIPEGAVNIPAGSIGVMPLPEGPSRPTIVVHYRAKIRPRPRPSEPVISFVPDAADTLPGGTTAASPEMPKGAPQDAPQDALATGPRGLADATGFALASSAPVFISPRPRPRPGFAPQGLGQRRVGGTRLLRRLPPPMVPPAAPFQYDPAPRQSFAAGTVCGDPAIHGQRIPTIQGRLPGCRIENPVKITSIDGVSLSQPSILDCPTARTLRGWIGRSLKPMFRGRGGGIAKLTILSHYACRTRNSRPGAKLSEHAKGHAIDIGAFTTRDGTRITVREGWHNWRQKRLLRRLHDSACGPFGTVLGPDANRYHQDHFHFDTAHYRGGPYCR